VPYSRMGKQTNQLEAELPVEELEDRFLSEYPLQFDLIAGQEEVSEPGPTILRHS
jgi:hypothetical protein